MRFRLKSHTNTHTLKKLRRKSQETKIAAWSLNGRLKEGYRQEEIIKDVRDYKVEVAALQEAMWNWNADAATKGDRGEEIINFQSSAQGYRGLGFCRLVATKAPFIYP